MPLLLAVATRRAGRRRLGDLRPQDLRQPLAGVDLRRLPRHGHVRSRTHPQIVHGFLPRDADGIQIIETWDTLGMRATQSQDTVLDKAFVPDELVALVCPAGFAGAGLFQVAIFAWALMGFAAVYLGAAKRAFDITVESMPKRTSIALTNSMAHHPEVQHNVAEMRIAYDAAEAMLERTCADWATGVEHADWPVRLVGDAVAS